MVLLKIFVFLFTVGATVGFQPLVVIPGVGRVAGTIGSTAWSKRPIIQFYGIKYAESPNGPNRFQVSSLSNMYSLVPEVSLKISAPCESPSLGTRLRCLQTRSSVPVIQKHGRRSWERCWRLSNFNDTYTSGRPILTPTLFLNSKKNLFIVDWTISSNVLHSRRILLRRKLWGSPAKLFTGKRCCFGVRPISISSIWIFINTFSRDSWKYGRIGRYYGFGMGKN